MGGQGARLTLGFLLASAGAVAALLASAPAASAKRDSAEIRRTEYGTPHIKADSYRELGFGFGYAFAEDNICTAAEMYVTVDAERSRFFGPDGSYRQRGNGTTPSNLNSDFFWQKIIDAKVVPQLVARKPPLGPLPKIKATMRGYVAGYNHYLRRVGGAEGVKDPTCRSEPWVRPITLETAYRRLYQLLLLASQGVAVDGIAGAEPPAGGGSGGRRMPSAEELGTALEDGVLGTGIGSNAVAVGSDGTRDGRRGMLLGNPHFPWYGPERFYQFHASLPGRVRVGGGTLFGVPSVLIGYTRGLAWSHTVSTAFRFTPYELKLAPGDPTSYLVDGKPEAMSTQEVTVQVRQPDGSLAPRTRTLYSTRWGPVFTDLVGIPLPWTAQTAFAMADANVGNFRAFNHFFKVNHADSVNDLVRILRRYQGIPWVNTIAADRKGKALYADIGTMPGVTDAKAAACNTALGAALFEVARLPVLDGSRSDCVWEQDPSAAEPGLLGPDRQPMLVRRDYVTNSNDSYWLSNPEQPLEGFPRIVGDERTPRSLRTRIGLIMTAARIQGSDGLGPPGFTLAGMRRMTFSNRVYGGELTRDALVEMCRRFETLGGVAPSSSGPVPVGNACDVLAQWDLKANIDSRGDLLFRSFWNRASGAPNVWTREFDPADPVHTPSGLNTSDPEVQMAFGDAIRELEEAGIPLDATVGSQQYVDWGGERIPIHGGQGDPDGVFNAMWPETSIFPDADNKLFGPGHGSSYIQAVTWGRGPCPKASTILTYSLSENPQSPHRADQTRLFSRKRWVRDRFCESDIRRSPELQVTRIHRVRRR